MNCNITAKCSEPDKDILKADDRAFAVIGLNYFNMLHFFVP